MMLVVSTTKCEGVRINISYSLPFWTNKTTPLHSWWGPDSSVCIATTYGLVDRGIESRRQRDFTHLSRPPTGTIQTYVQWLTALSPAIKHSGCGEEPSTPFSTEVKERVEMYFYSPSGSSLPFIGWILPFSLSAHLTAGWVISLVLNETCIVNL
jgi:hypothetical protein